MAPQPPLPKWPPKTPAHVSASAKERAIIRQRNRKPPLSSDLIECSPAGVRLRVRRPAESHHHALLRSSASNDLPRKDCSVRSVARHVSAPPDCNVGLDYDRAGERYRA